MVQLGMLTLLQNQWAAGQQSSATRLIWSFLTTTVWQWDVCRLLTIRQVFRFLDMMLTQTQSKLSAQENSPEQFLRTLMLRQQQHCRFSATCATDLQARMFTKKESRSLISTATRFLQTSFMFLKQKLCLHRTQV